MKKTLKRAWLAAIGAALAALMVLPATASAEVLTESQFTDIAIPTGGYGNPYPSTVFVSGADGKITDLNVSITLSHTWPDDVDIALVSPDGDEEIIMSDVCGSTDLASVSLPFNDEAGAQLGGGPCASGSFKPSNVDNVDNWDNGGPGTVSTALLSNFDNENPNGTWELYVLDDEAIGDSGTVHNWTLTITTATAELIIPSTGSSGKARQYPSTKALNTAPGTVISDLNVVLKDINHTFAADMDMLLAGPRRGAKSIVISDACGSLAMRHFEYTFDDEASAIMSNGAGCNFQFLVKPTDYGTGDVFPAPAPAGPHGATFTAFDGLEGGTFSLFANDDAGGDSGYISSWELKATTRNAADTGFAGVLARVEEGGQALLTVNRSGPAVADLGPATINVTTGGTATAGADFTAPATVEFARGQTSATVAIPIVGDQVNEPVERFNVVLSSPRDDARLTGAASAEVVIGPDNEIKLGKLKRNKRKGTAKLFVTVPGPGVLVLSGDQVKKVKKTVQKAGKVGLPIKPKGNAMRILNEDGKTKVRAKVAFTPTEGTTAKKTKKVKLVLED